MLGRGACSQLVMPGLTRAYIEKKRFIHVDGCRVKPGNDDSAPRSPASPHAARAPCLCFRVLPRRARGSGCVSNELGR